MNNARAANPGKTRVCPHCRSEILVSAAVCPGCKHHLRFGPTAERVQPSFSALSVEGTIRHPGDEPWEYAVVVCVRNERGDEIARQVVQVGAIHSQEQRSFSLSVEVFAPGLASASG